jgi:hypothetical protein
MIRVCRDEAADRGQIVEAVPRDQRLEIVAEALWQLPRICRIEEA